MPTCASAPAAGRPAIDPRAADRAGDDRAEGGGAPSTPEREKRADRKDAPPHRSSTKERQTESSLRRRPPPRVAASGDDRSAGGASDAPAPEEGGDSSPREERSPPKTPPSVRQSSFHFTSDLLPSRRPSHRSGMLHAFRSSPLLHHRPLKKLQSSTASNREEHAFAWIQNVAHLDAAAEHFAELGYDEEGMAFVPYSAKENWLERYPQALPVLECDEDGSLVPGAALAGGWVAAAMASAGGSGDEAADAPAKKKRDRRPPKNIFNDDTLLPDAERDELHVEIYNYLSWLHAKLSEVERMSVAHWEAKKAAAKATAEEDGGREAEGEAANEEGEVEEKKEDEEAEGEERNDRSCKRSRGRGRQGDRGVHLDDLKIVIDRMEFAFSVIPTARLEKEATSSAAAAYIVSETAAALEGEGEKEAAEERPVKRDKDGKRKIDRPTVLDLQARIERARLAAGPIVVQASTLAETAATSNADIESLTLTQGKEGSPSSPEDAQRDEKGGASEEEGTAEKQRKGERANKPQPACPVGATQQPKPPFLEENLRQALRQLVAAREVDGKPKRRLRRRKPKRKADKMYGYYERMARDKRRRAENWKRSKKWAREADERLEGLFHRPARYKEEHGGCLVPMKYLGADSHVRAGLGREEVRLISAQVMHLRRELSDLREESARRDHTTRDSLSRIDRSVARLAITSARRSSSQEMSPSEDADESLPERRGAILMPRPKTLHDLWKEYQFGGPGRKPAKNFDHHERGQVKSTYSTRKPLWDKVKELVQNGVSAQVACDRVYEAYGESLSVTKILRKMKEDRRTGNWPVQLRVRVE